MKRLVVATLAWCLSASLAYTQPPPPPRLIPPPPLPTAPRPATPLTRAAPPAASSLDEQIQALSRLVQPYQQVMIGVTGLVQELRPRLNEALALAARNAPDTEVKLWADGWTPQLMERMAAIERMDKAIPPLDPAEVMRIVTPFNFNGQFDEAVSAYPALTHAEVASIRTVLEDFTRLSPAVAKGDENALKLMSSKLMATSRLTMETENMSLQVGMAAIAADHPQRAYMKSLTFLNRFMIDMLGALGASVEGQPVDNLAVARQLQISLDEGRAAARQIGPLSERMVARANEIATPQERLILGRLSQAFGTYSTTQQLVLNAFDELAGIVEVVKTTGNVSELEKQMAAVSNLLTRINEVERQRRATLTG